MKTFPKKSGIYLLANKINGKIYVGKASNLYIRASVHKNSSKSIKSDHGMIIVRALRKYGWENFTFVVLELCPKSNLFMRETFWIKKLKSSNLSVGYNLKISGIGPTGYKHNTETKERISQTRKKLQIASGCKNPFWGKRHSSLSKKKMRLAGQKRNLDYLKKTIKQIDLSSGNVIKIWPSSVEAAFGLGGNEINASSIRRVCKNYVNKRGQISKSALGYGWEYV